MRIQREEMDPQMVERLLSGIQALAFKQDMTEEERRLFSEMRRRFAFRWGPFWWWTLGGLALGTGIFLSVLTGAGSEPGAILGGLGGGLGTFVGMMAAGFGHSFSTWHQRIDIVHPDLLAAALPLLSLSRVEKAYGEALVPLAALESLDERTGRDILSQLNSLTAHYRQLEAQRERLRAAIGGNTAESLQVEREALQRRAKEANDPVTKRALQESLQMCEARLQQAQALEPALHRMDAQQEVIIQTLASVRASLARLQLVSAAVSAPEVEEIQRTVLQISTQAQAMEQAVQEVMAVRVE